MKNDAQLIFLFYEVW